MSEASPVFDRDEPEKAFEILNNLNGTPGELFIRAEEIAIELNKGIPFINQTVCVSAEYIFGYEIANYHCGSFVGKCTGYYFIKLPDTDRYTYCLGFEQKEIVGSNLYRQIEETRFYYVPYHSEYLITEDYIPILD